MRNLNFLKNETESISTKMTLKNSQKLLIGFLALVLVAGMTSPAFAEENSAERAAEFPGSLEAVPTDDSYLGTFWTGIGSVDGAAFGVFPGADSPWTFDCGDKTCWFTVVDGGQPIDQFEVFDDGQSIGLTSVPSGVLATNCGFDDPDACLADPDFTSGTFCLEQGPHSITMDQILNAGIGNGWFKVSLHETAFCDAPIGGTSFPVSTTSLLVAGAQANMGLLSLALVGVVVAGAAIVYKKKSKKTEQ